MNKGVHVGTVQVVLFVPGRRRQDDVGVESRGVHAEVDVHHQVEFAFGRFFVPLDILDELFGSFGSNGIGVRAKVMLEEILVALGARHQGVAAPDDPHARPVFRSIGIFNSKLHLLLGQLLNCPVNYLLIVAGTGSFGFLHRIDWAAVKLREERQPAVAYSTDLMIDSVSFGNLVAFRNRVNLDLVGSSLVTPLIGMNIMVGGCILETRRFRPIEGPHDRSPRCAPAPAFLDRRND